LRDTDQRPRVLRHRAGRFPFPVPNGWFIVAAAADLMPGEVAPPVLRPSEKDATDQRRWARQFYCLLPLVVESRTRSTA
jgi:hypothetical protein